MSIKLIRSGPRRRLKRVVGELGLVTSIPSSASPTTRSSPSRFFSSISPSSSFYFFFFFFNLRPVFGLASAAPSPPCPSLLAVPPLVSPLPYYHQRHRCWHHRSYFLALRTGEEGLLILRDGPHIDTATGICLHLEFNE